MKHIDLIILTLLIGTFYSPAANAYFIGGLGGFVIEIFAIIVVFIVGFVKKRKQEKVQSQFKNKDQLEFDFSDESEFENYNEQKEAS